MDLYNIITDKNFSYHRISSLIILVVISTIGVVFVTNVLIGYFNYPWVFFSAWLFIIIVIIGTWIYNRVVFPKGSNTKITLVLGITTENVSQKVRITKDTAQKIEKLLIKYNLSNKYEVKVLHNHLSKRLAEIIRLCTESLKAGLNESESKTRFKTLSKRMNAKFFVYGDLIKRDSPEGKYLLSIEALMQHSSPTKEQGKLLKEEFNNLWSNEIKILESDELNGFRSNAENLFFTASYMLGLATFVDNQFLDGIKIFEKLEQYLIEKEELRHFTEKIKQLKGASYFLQSRFEYFSGNIEESIAFREKFLEITPNAYDSLLNQAIREVTINNRPEVALKHILKAKELANKDGIWRYSKFYLEILLNKESDALDTLKEIINNNFNEELDCVNQVIVFNNQRLSNDPNHVQSHFIIGVFYYKKLSNPVLAYENLEQFIYLCEKSGHFPELNTYAKTALLEIDKILKIK